MLGWEFMVFRHQGEEKKELVCHWMAGSSGMKWLKDLASDGKVVDLGGNGYPCCFVACAEILRATLIHGLPRANGPLVIGDDYILEPGWTSRITWRNQAVLLGDPTQRFLIEAWDQS